MKIKCCGQSKKRKGGVTPTELETASGKIYAERLALKPLDGYIKDFTEFQLTILSDIARRDMLALTTELAKRNGSETSDGSTDINKPITINIPGAGDCQYTGD